MHAKREREHGAIPVLNVTSKEDICWTSHIPTNASFGLECLLGLADLKFHTRDDLGDVVYRPHHDST